MNKTMKKGRLKKGFTIIEVVLFLAISGAIFAAIMSNTAATVARRRYTDSVQSFVEEIRNAYSATVNVENYRIATEDSSYFCSVTAGFINGSLTPNSLIDNSAKKTADNYPGRTKCAVYGQILTFGEGGSTNINRYDLIGIAATDKIDINDNGSGIDETLSSLKKVGANIVTMTQIPINATTPTTCKASLAGTSSHYTPQWTGTIENKKDRNFYHGAIMIARSPLSATVHTYFYSATGDISQDNPDDGVFEVQKWLNTTGTGSCAGFKTSADKFAAIDQSHWRNDKDLDICVGSEDLFATNYHRRAIRIHADGSTESSVELLSETESDNVCTVVTP